MSRTYSCRPSELMKISEDYAAFCFDEACDYILGKIEDDEEPKFKKKFGGFSDYYSDLERRDVICR